MGTLRGIGSPTGIRPVGTEYLDIRTGKKWIQSAVPRGSNWTEMDTNTSDDNGGNVDLTNYLTLTSFQSIIADYATLYDVSESLSYYYNKVATDNLFQLSNNPVEIASKNGNINYLTSTTLYDGYFVRIINPNLVLDDIATINSSMDFDNNLTGYDIVSNEEKYAFKLKYTGNTNGGEVYFGGNLIISTENYDDWFLIDASQLGGTINGYYTNGFNGNILELECRKVFGQNRNVIYFDSQYLNSELSNFGTGKFFAYDERSSNKNNIYYYYNEDYANIEMKFILKTNQINTNAPTSNIVSTDYPNLSILSSSYSNVGQYTIIFNYNYFFSGNTNIFIKNIFEPNPISKLDIYGYLSGDDRIKILSYSGTTLQNNVLNNSIITVTTNY